MWMETCGLKHVDGDIIMVDGGRLHVNWCMDYNKWTCGLKHVDM